ncbi:hypothetical protein Lfu02_76320 [Longispora fulva]|uniref:Uncharacterized protein n=1 Tax=Longispora fulva TaxID=619741 RepID=A0A8J7GKM4_9ACTN|nr:hypothetical protein [Longispora fulva]GIG63260.1 hypothetical protein Lfu02_76320 [Longispora fulva]
MKLGTGARSPGTPRRRLPVHRPFNLRKGVGATKSTERIKFYELVIQFLKVILTFFGP